VLNEKLGGDVTGGQKPLVSSTQDDAFALPKEYEIEDDAKASRPPALVAPDAVMMTGTKLWSLGPETRNAKKPLPENVIPASPGGKDKAEMLIVISPSP
jgi:hypothetical protein